MAKLEKGKMPSCLQLNNFLSFLPFLSPVVFDLAASQSGLHNDMENGTQFHHAGGHVAGVWVRTPPPGDEWRGPWRTESASGPRSPQKARSAAEAHREVSGNGENRAGRRTPSASPKRAQCAGAENSSREGPAGPAGHPWGPGETGAETSSPGFSPRDGPR